LRPNADVPHESASARHACLCAVAPLIATACGSMGQGAAKTENYYESLATVRAVDAPRHLVELESPPANMS
jgi:hypothetical protein